jgi:phage baseplate assembly protein W
MAFDANPKAHLGAGWAFPVKPVGGRLQFARYEEDIEQAIQIILLTTRRERPMLPQFGAGMRNFVFEPNSARTHRAIEEAVRKSLLDWEPRINLERVEVTPDPDEPNRLLIHVDYVVRATNTFYNRVFPFYLLEGGA